MISVDCNLTQDYISRSTFACPIEIYKLNLKRKAYHDKRISAPRF